MAQYRLYRPWAAEPASTFDQLRREMDDVLDRFGGISATPSERQGVFPAVNLYETADAYMLTAELPGVESDDVHVSLHGSTVTVSGERKIDYATQKDASLHRRERQGGSFRRAFQLPVAIDGDKVEATHTNGVLMLRLPKTPEHQPRQIAVQTR
jgi:HSP20 family protein